MLSNLKLNIMNLTCHDNYHDTNKRPEMNIIIFK